jgi:hypothetical protein
LCGNRGLFDGEGNLVADAEVEFLRREFRRVLDRVDAAMGILRAGDVGMALAVLEHQQRNGEDALGDRALVTFPDEVGQNAVVCAACRGRGLLRPEHYGSPDTCPDCGGTGVLSEAEKYE